jgi:hypothetical protein
MGEEDNELEAPLRWGCRVVGLYSLGTVEKQRIKLSGDKHRDNYDQTARDQISQGHLQVLWVRGPNDPEMD